MSELKVTWLRIGDITPYETNPRIHTEDHVLAVAASITEFGWTTPILLDADNVIVAGHGRYLAAAHLEMEEVPTLRLSDLSEDQVRAYRIADNRLVETSQWDRLALSADRKTFRRVGDRVVVDYPTDGLDPSRLRRAADRRVVRQERLSI